jgi:hypothetical protein
MKAFVRGNLQIDYGYVAINNDSSSTKEYILKDIELKITDKNHVARCYPRDDDGHFR